MQTQKEKSILFKSLHDQEGCFIIPNPWDAGTAKLLAHLGFKALATTSAGLAFSMGHPDSKQLVSREKVLDNAKAIVSATELPVSADLENGYSDHPQGVFDIIQLAGSIGLAGASIEDVNGQEMDPIYPFEFAVERIQAAVESKNKFDFPFVLTARAENYLHKRFDLKDTIRRLQAFQEAGADVLFAPGLRSYNEIHSVIQSVDKPVNVLIGAGQTIDRLTDLGVKRISLGSSLIRSALASFLRAATEVKSNGTVSFIPDSIPYNDLNEIFRTL